MQIAIAAGLIGQDIADARNQSCTVGLEGPPVTCGVLFTSLAKRKRLLGFDAKRSSQVANLMLAAAPFLAVAGAALLAHAAVLVAPQHILTSAAGAEPDGQFSDAALARLAHTLDPGVLALAQRYAPAPHTTLADGVAGQLSDATDDDLDQGPLAHGEMQLSAVQAAVNNASVPASRTPTAPAAPFNLGQVDVQTRGRALDCLSMAVYYEAASQSDQGQAAVAQVVLNRVRHPAFPNSVCGVVFEGSKLPTGCQFSFTCDGSLARRPSDAGWARAQAVAARALGGYVVKEVGEATHYHTMWVVPYWRESLTKLTQIGAHIFYRWPGGAGQPQAFAMGYAGREAAPPSEPGHWSPPTSTATSLAALEPVDAAPQPSQSSAPAPAPVVLAEAPTVVLAPVAAPAAPIVLKQSFFGSARRDVVGRPAMAAGG